MQQHLAENIIEIYRKHGRAWTELRGDTLYERAWLELFNQHLPKHSNILDLGCGSGRTIANFFIQNGHHIVGVDSSDVMIEMAYENFPAHTWIVQDMRTVDLDETFDGILAWDSFFHLTQDDQRAMFLQFAKYAKNGAALMFTSGPSCGEAIGDMFGESLYHSSLSTEEYKDLLTKNGFELIKMIADDPNCTGHTVWLAKKMN